MAFYLKKGNIPEKRHIQHRDRDGNLYYEELISRQGFSDIYTNAYHISLPTRVKQIDEFEPLEFNRTSDQKLRHHHWRTFKFTPESDIHTGRKYLAFNSDAVLSTASPVEDQSFFYRNALADEVIFVHKGSGKLESQFGDLDFVEGDYIVIPRSITYKIQLQGSGHRFFITETAGPVGPPTHFYNRFGQLLEHAPYSERDFRLPEFVDPIDAKGDFPVKIKTSGGFQNIILDHHPFDLVGWDGFYYPWIFNIKDFMPQVGKVHLPPPVHQTFGARGLVICSFVPRLFDFHEKAIPAPYNHSNVDSDEILYYVEGDFMSRKGIEEGSITLHPMGLPHGPQPGKIEASIGKKSTSEYAVMVDTFKPLLLTDLVDDIDDPDYPSSWMK